MPNDRRIKKITEAKLPLELVDKSVYAELRAREHTYVRMHSFRSSRVLLTSENFSACQGVCLLDLEEPIGMLAHLHPDDRPELCIDWQMGRG